MRGQINRHPLLQKYCDAREGKRCTREHTLASNAILKRVNTSNPFPVNVLRIARDNKINSQAVVDVLGWMLKAGILEPVGPRHYIFTREFKALGLH